MAGKGTWPLNLNTTLPAHVDLNVSNILSSRIPKNELALATNGDFERRRHPFEEYVLIYVQRIVKSV